MDCLLIYFPECREPAKRLAAQMGLNSAQIRLHNFPDGESLVTLPEPLPSCVIIYRSLNQPNGKLVELLLAARGARDKGVANLIMVAPYLAYMRQDRSFSPGQVVSQKIIGLFLSELFDSLVTVDAHLHRVKDLGQILPGCTAVNLTSSGLTSRYILESCSQRPFLLGPDEESIQWVSGIAEMAGLEYGVCNKVRYGDTHVEVSLPVVDLADRHVILIDDIASTGYTLANVAVSLRERGVDQIDCIVTHALFARGALKLLKTSGIRRVITTDTVPHSTNRIFTAQLVAKVLKEFI